MINNVLAKKKSESALILSLQNYYGSVPPTEYSLFCMNRSERVRAKTFLTCSCYFDQEQTKY